MASETHAGYGDGTSRALDEWINEGGAPPVGDASVRSRLAMGGRALEGSLS